MKTISLGVSEDEYEAFRRAAEDQERPVAELIREAMAWYRTEQLEVRPRLEELPVLAGHRPVAPLPSRAEVYEEMFGQREPAKR